MSGNAPINPPAQLVRHLTAPTPQIVDWDALRLTVDGAGELIGARLKTDGAAWPVDGKWGGPWAISDRWDTPVS